MEDIIRKSKFALLGTLRWLLVKVNVDDLREYMMNELLGVAFCCDFPASLIGVAEIESMGPQ